MTFETFRATGRESGDLWDECDDASVKGRPGRVYCGCLWIEDASDWPTDAPGFGQGRWYTIIGRDEYQSDDLESIERRLYDFAVSEGIGPRD